ncbi:MAG: sterol desaturase family protein [Myxococcota bacterium]|nr:sterol desaturase family protein [Myxococcota bacterium]
MIYPAPDSCRTARALRVAAYPVLFLATLGGGLALLRAGAPEPIALLAPTIALAVSLAALERVIPWERAWLAPRGDVPTDRAHAIATLMIAPAIQGLVIALLPHVEHGLLAGVPWLAAEIAIVVLLGDLGPYFAHRAMHEKSELLFRIHAVHHAPTRLWWLNAFRVHPLNLVANVTLRIVPGLLLGASHEALFAAALISGFANVFAHANVDVRLGVLDWIFSGPALHRLHHHVEPARSQSNYGGTTILWDVLFGTRRAPRERVGDGDVGVGDAAPPEGWLAQLLHPFGVRCCAAA